jgi:peptidylprolyl isomerase
VIQGGDPQGTGKGGGIMSTELNNEPFTVGSVGVARGSNINESNDSQFFICTAECGWLTNQYTNFGEVVEGLEVAQSIAIGDTIQSIQVE